MPKSKHSIKRYGCNQVFSWLTNWKSYLNLLAESGSPAKFGQYCWDNEEQKEEDACQSEGTAATDNNVKVFLGPQINPDGLHVWLGSKNLLRL